MAAESECIHGPHPKLTVRGLDQALWEWARARAVLEDKTVGDLLNFLLARYRNEMIPSTPDSNTPVMPLENDRLFSIRGIDRSLWRWVKFHSALERSTVSGVLNGIIQKYKDEVGEPIVKR